MKKVSLMVVGLLLILLSYSQDFNKVIRATKSEWNGNEWKIIRTSEPAGMFIIIKDWEITVGTYKFRTFDDPEKNVYEKHVTYTWKCVNGDGEKCFFMMKKFKPEVTSHSLYTIVYDSGVMYEYETE
jgi:hypothetical protein